MQGLLTDCPEQGTIRQVFFSFGLIPWSEEIYFGQIPIRSAAFPGTNSRQSDTVATTRGHYPG